MFRPTQSQAGCSFCFLLRSKCVAACVSWSAKAKLLSHGIQHRWVGLFVSEPTAKAASRSCSWQSTNVAASQMRQMLTCMSPSDHSSPSSSCAHAVPSWPWSTWTRPSLPWRAHSARTCRTPPDGATTELLSHSWSRFVTHTVATKCHCQGIGLKLNVHTHWHHVHVTWRVCPQHCLVTDCSHDA